MNTKVLIVFIFIVLIALCIALCITCNEVERFKAEKSTPYFKDLRPYLKSVESMSIFDVERIIPCTRESKKAYVFSLFTKRFEEQPGYFSSQDRKRILELTEKNLKKETLIRGNKHVKERNGTFWTSYFQPLIDDSNELVKQKDWKMRIYLANDLQFVIPYFNSETTEIFVMSECSSGINPGAMWRFLCLDDNSLDVCYIRDADDRISRANIQWDHPKIRKDSYIVASRPHVSSESRKQGTLWGAGTFVGFPKNIQNHSKTVRQLMESTIDAKLPRELTNRPDYPNYGYDEVFLTNILYYEFGDRVALLFSGLGIKEDPIYHSSNINRVIL